MKSISVKVFAVLVFLFVSGFIQSAHAAGELDVTFGGGTWVHTPAGIVGSEIYNAAAKKIAIQSDGKIILITDAPPYNRWGVLRLNPDGSLDAGFGVGGVSFVDFNNYFDAGVYAVAIQDDGKIIVAGNARNRRNLDYDSYFAAARLNPDGSIDQDFDNDQNNKDGKVILDVFQGLDIPRGGIKSIMVQNDGKIVLAGWAHQSNNNRQADVVGGFAVARLNTDGTVDNTFDPVEHDGIVRLSVRLTMEDAKIQPDGKFVLVGTLRLDPNTQKDIGAYFRLNNDGSFDQNFAQFGGLGVLYFPVRVQGLTAIQYTYDFFEHAHELELQDDGRIVIRAWVIQQKGQGDPYKYGLVKINPDGKFDLSFDNGVKKHTGGQDLWPQSMALQRDRKILEAGTLFLDPKQPGWSTDFSVLRYTEMGNPDLAFNPKGNDELVTVDFQGNYWEGAYDIAVQPDCKILVSGVKCWRANLFAGYLCAPAVARLLSGLEKTKECTNRWMPAAIFPNWQPVGELVLPKEYERPPLPIPPNPLSWDRPLELDTSQLPIKNATPEQSIGSPTTKDAMQSKGFPGDGLQPFGMKTDWQNATPVSKTDSTLPVPKSRSTNTETVQPVQKGSTLTPLKKGTTSTPVLQDSTLSR